ncbi:MAG TPA: LemA family protein [Fimbriimonadaceae bacterium]|jgi:hypothetical protein
MLILISFVCLALGVIVFRLYEDLANLRRQLQTAKAQIEAQIALRRDLLRQFKESLYTEGSGPRVVGAEAHKIMADVKSAEDKIEFAKRYYNTIAEQYDHRLRMFPYSLLHLPPQEFIELSLDNDGLSC